MKESDSLQESCTHNCMTCGHGCAEGSDGVGKIEKALCSFSELDAQELLKGLQSLAEED